MQRAQSVSSDTRPKVKRDAPDKRRQSGLIQCLFFSPIYFLSNVSDAKFIPRKPTEQDQIVGYDGDQSLVFGTSASGLLLSSMDTSNNSGRMLGNTSIGGESSLSTSEQQLPCIDEEREILHKRNAEDSAACVLDNDRRRMALIFEFKSHIKSVSFDYKALE